VDFGHGEGLTFAQLQRHWPDLARRLGAGEAHLDWPDGERARDFLARVRAAWRKIQAVVRARDVIVVSHGGPLRVLSGLACGDSSVDGVLGPGAGITSARRRSAR
jgi:broad specificity phosphatase PhoE